MSNFSVIFVISVIFVSNIVCNEIDHKFCSKNRKLLLGGVFNVDRIIFASSWIDPNPNYKFWRFEVKKNKLVEFGTDVFVPEMFPNVPLVRAGFGLNIKCEASDETCRAYRQLVFVFFQTQFKVFRFSNDHFALETDKSKIPWSLTPSGPYTDWYFGSTTLDSTASFAAFAFVSGEQSQIFMVSRDVLSVSPVDVKAAGLTWKQVAKSHDLTSTQGAFSIGSEFFINRKVEPSDNILMKYDQNGKLLEEIPVWNFFGCDPNSDTSGFMAASGDKVDEEQVAEELYRKHNTLATIILIFVVIVIIITNIITGIYWFIVYKTNKNVE